MQNSGFLFAAYSIVWAVLFIYVLVLVNRQAKLHQSIESLKNTGNKENQQ